MSSNALIEWQRMLMMWVIENANGIAIRYYIWIAAEQKWLFILRVKDIEHTVGPCWDASSDDFRQDCNGGTDIELGYDWLCLSVYGSNKWVNSYYRETFTIIILHTQCPVFPSVSEFDVMCVDIIWTLLLHLQLQMTQRHVRSLNFFIQLF